MTEAGSDPELAAREAVDAAERAALDIVHPFDHPRIHRVFQDLRAALPARSDAGLNVKRLAEAIEVVGRGRNPGGVWPRDAEAIAALAAVDND